MSRVRLLLIGGLAAVAGLVGATFAGLGDTATAMPPSVFRVTLTNMTEPASQISPGALVGHCEDGLLWSEGSAPSAGIVKIATMGEPSDVVGMEQEETAMGMTFVQERHQIGGVASGESVSVNAVFEFGCKLSSAHMIVSSDNTFVGAQSVGMWDPDTHLPLEMVSVDLMAYDAGDTIMPSEQYPGVQAKLTIEFVEDAMQDDSMDSDDHGHDDSMDGDDHGHDDSMDGDDHGHEDEMEDDGHGHMGMPHTGTGGLADRAASGASTVTYLLAALAATSVAIAGLSVGRRVSQRR